VLDLDLNDASGGWVGSVIDLAKFTSMLDGARPRGLLTQPSFASMVEQTPNGRIPDSPSWYGFGLFVVSQLGGVTWSHGGAAPGTNAWFYRFANGVGYVFVFNGATEDHVYPNAYTAQPVWDTVAAVRVWPEHDFFPRYYPPTISNGGALNAASFQPGPLAPGSLSTILGVDLGGRDSGVSASLSDAAGAEWKLELLFSGPGQLNTVLPGEVTPGEATFRVQRDGWPSVSVATPIVAVAPGVFTLNPVGLIAASLVRSIPGQPQVWESVFDIDPGGNVIGKPIVFGVEGEDVSLVLYCTGVRGRGSLRAVNVLIGDLSLPVSYAGPQFQYAGLDQINVRLPRTRAGAGSVSVRVEVDGLASNIGVLTFR
jgi:uncharacterized protein (TIGR03437 family)